MIEKVSKWAQQARKSGIVDQIASLVPGMGGIASSIPGMGAIASSIPGMGGTDTEEDYPIGLLGSEDSEEQLQARARESTSRGVNAQVGERSYPPSARQNNRVVPPGGSVFQGVKKWTL